MSGGSYGYAYTVMNEMADSIEHKDSDGRRKAFSELLHLVAKACHAIEWVDSCDYAKGDEYKAIDAVFSFLNADPLIIAKARAFDGLRSTLAQYLGSVDVQTGVKK
jgi:hypothetical protein